jgi:hypothetical protein
MGVFSLYTESDQQSSHDDILRNRDILNAEEYQPILAKIEKFGGFRTAIWMPKLNTAIERLEEAMDLRDTSSDLQTVNADQVAGHLLKIQEWFAEGEGALAIAVKGGVPGAPELRAVIQRAAGTQATFKDLNGPLRKALNSLAKVGDLAQFQLTADYADRGRALRFAVLDDRGELHGNQMGITVGAMAFHVALENVASLYEDHDLSVQLASLRLKEELPGLDLRYIRASLARRRPAVAAATAAAAAAAPDLQPPSDSGL